MIKKLMALVLASLGVWSMHSGIAAREALEPKSFVAGAGLIPGVGPALPSGAETPGLETGDSRTGHKTPAIPGEVRSSVLAAVAPGVASAGGTRRSLGVGLLAAALSLAWLGAFGNRRGDGTRAASPWLSTLVLIPGAYALFRLGAGTSAAAPAAVAARAAFWLWGPAVGLALLLLSSPRTGRARPR